MAILGLLTVFGRQGWISSLFALVGLPPLDIYGFHGVVLAHVFFNLPLATRLILQGWLSVPAEQFRLAASLSLGPRQITRLIEWPMLRTVLPGAFLVILLICLSSFAVALTLGGGPRATTVELGIYQALRFDFDLGRAALLAMIQVLLCVGAGILALGLTLPAVGLGGLGRPVERWDAHSPIARLLDALWIGMATLFLALPLAAIALRGLTGLTEIPPSIWAALGRSLAVALGSAALATGLAMCLALAPRSAQSFAGTLPLAISPLVLGTGLFLLLRPYGSPLTWALPLTALVNALMSLPFALRSLAPALAEAEASYGRLATSLGMRGWSRLRWFLLPRLRRPLGFAAGLAAALSMGDLGVIALFAGANGETLPLAMYRLMGAYKTEAAAATALILVASTLALFWIFDRGARLDADL